MRLLPFLVGAVQAINILMNNDDGFGSGNLRETYRLLKEKGHNVWIVAPATKQSGMGGKSDFTTEANLTGPSQYDLIPKGAPSLGSDPHDSHIWYYNGTPAACTFVALDAVLPKHGDFKVPDLVVTGPNYGTNLGPFVWTLSGTAGAAYAAVERSIPAVAFSASNEALSYKEVTNTSNPATWAAQVSVHVIEQLIKSAPKDSALLPLGYGLNVNIPPLHNASIPEIIQTRMNGGAHVNEAIEKDGVFTWRNLQPKAAGINACVSGDCNLPDETYVVEHGSVSISTFIVDYSAPENFYAKGIRKRLEPLTKKDHGH